MATLDVAKGPYNAAGDGVGDDTAPIQDAIDDAAGGGTVYIPGGTYKVSGLDGASGVLLRGEPGAKLLLADGADTHLIKWTGCTGVGMVDLALDGNRANNSVGHVVRLEDVTLGRFERLAITDAPQYGFGMQGGTMTNVVLELVSIDGAGLDGLDIKNPDNANAGVILRVVTVRNFGLLGGSQKAGIDLRGPVQGQLLEVDCSGTDNAAGIRCRHGETTTTHGLGGHETQLGNCKVFGDTDTEGFYFDAQRVTGDNLVASDCQNAFYVGQEFCQLTAIRAVDSARGLYVNDRTTTPDMPTEADYLTVDGFTGTGLTIDGARIETDHVVMRAVQLEGASGSKGIYLLGTSSDCDIEAELSGSWATPVDDDGSGNTVTQM